MAYKEPVWLEDDVVLTRELMETILEDIRDIRRRAGVLGMNEVAVGLGSEGGVGGLELARGDLLSHDGNEFVAVPMGTNNTLMVAPDGTLAAIPTDQCNFCAHIVWWTG